MKAKAVCFFCFRKLWQTCAIILVLLAVIVSILKYTLPYANDYKGDIETYLHSKFDVSLSIGSISASWQGSGPALVLEDLSFKDNETAPISLTIAKTSLELNLWESLKTLQLKSNYFVISGFHTSVNVGNLFNGNEQGEVSFEQKELIEGLFLGETGHFAIENSSVNFILEDGKERKVMLKNITWQNEDKKHLGSGSLALPGISVGNFDARIALSGKTLEKVIGDMYVQANKVDVSNWLAQYITSEKQQLHSDINLQAWFKLEKGLFSDIKVQWLPSFVRWQYEEKNQQVSLSEGGFHLYPEQNGWRLKSTGLTFASNSKAWPSLEFEAKLDAQNKVWLQQVDLELLNNLAGLTNFTGLAPFLEREPSGLIKQAYLKFESVEQWQLWFEADNIGWQELDSVPAAQELRVSGLVNQASGRISLFGENGTLVTGENFSNDIQYNQINIDLDLVNRKEGWHISSDEIWFDNNEITLAAEMQLSLGDTPRLDLYAEAFAPDASIAGHYFPLKAMSPELVSYLNGAIKGGEVSKAQVLFAGPLSGFPFTDGSGQFDVLAQIDNATYEFDLDWPAVTNANVQLHFANERMDIYSQQGKLVNLDIGHSVQVSIADLMNADELIVQIDKKAEMEKLHDFFAATPIAKPLAEIFKVVQGKGEADASIELLVGSKFKGGASVSGKVNLNDLPVFIATPGIELKNLTGELNFINDNITLKNATAKWLGMPLNINYSSKSDAKNYQANIDINAKVDADTLIDSGQGILKNYLSGQSDVDIGLVLNFTEQGFNYRAQVNSELLGLTSNLPAPYNKNSEQAWALDAVVQGDDISNLITANANQQFYFNAILENGKSQFSNAHFVIGKQDLGLNQKGLSVNINLEQSELVPWFDLIDQIIKAGKANPDKESKGIMPPLNEVVANVGMLDASNIIFNDFEMRLAPSKDDLYLKLNAKELRAGVFIPTSQPSQPIRINTDYLRLNFAQPSEQLIEITDVLPEEDLSWLTKIPAIEFECSDCKIDRYQLDKVSASLLGDGERLSILELVIDKGDHVLRTKGQWQNGLTTLNGELKSDDIGALFGEFDITSAIKDSKADLNYDLTWQAAPYDFDVKTLSGQIEWDLGEGHLTEISDGGARVFSLLSLDSLVRKLKLDFRDVFSKGFFYNSMQGSMQLENGIAYTKDTKMDGVPADLTIKGYANLNTLDIDYDLAVAPQVTSSIPVIVAWMVNPVTGLAALALDKVIHSARVISEINFKVTGKMNDPIVQELDRKSREVTLPQAAQNQPQASVDLKLKDAQVTVAQ
ncbi:YhdP family protein [Pseudoalteromonas fuliginea]|uniref:TIGR02099 family protein n=1 Tax=Pseudoalteromonas fuliginea TaxID=1872678 RepID=A0ABQ6RJG6_9GAMM|nr:YhdP family protein [Pseudoalteromonas fuliginea]KAA1158815.1 TIGR02099 family protein [Pseudoalteromonas fuliginea]KAA1167967.1 TIGR02099 family protein [Pseudoalteromonas fuliginea]